MRVIYRKRFSEKKLATLGLKLNLTSISSMKTLRFALGFFSEVLID
jgi:hypothetical protein